LVETIFDSISNNSIFLGFQAFVAGFIGSISSPKIRSTYLRFLGYFLLITLLAYAAISTTMIVGIVLVSLLLLGPVVGPILIVGISSVTITILLILGIIGQFPKHIFLGSFGLLRPFFTATQLSFLLAILLIPNQCDQFVLEGINVMILKQRQQQTDKNNNNKIRLEYEKEKPALLDTIWLFFCNFGYAMFLKMVILRLLLFFSIILLFGSSTRSSSFIKLLLQNVVSSYILGSQLVSVYTVRIRRMSFICHMRWCTLNCFRIIGFALPLQLIQTQQRGNLTSFLWLGLTYSSSAKLVETIVRKDLSILNKSKNI